MMSPRPSSTATGVACGLGAYLAWGFIALYFKLLTDRGVDPAPMLAHRVVWSTLFCGALVLVVGAAGEARRVLVDRRKILALSASAALIAANWLAFIHSVHIHQLGQSALGYYVNPLLSVLLGAVVLRERLRAVEWLSVLLAAVGATVIVLSRGGLPWIAVTVAVTFSLYGLLRKQIAVSAVVGLAVETALLSPLALVYLGVHAGDGAVYSGGVYGLLILSGVVTAVPLLLFAQAARALRLSTMGFLQYLAPTCQLLVATFLLREPITASQLAGFGCIWAGLLLFTAVAARSRSTVTAARVAPSAPAAGAPN
ncbi:MAG TPA: EamA family transporter RarD [Tepidisphaeraceae bacterium]|jgi:chloramphenicol-sensitive protein RarD